FSLGHELDLAPGAFGELTRSDECIGQPAELQRRLDDDGYLFIPGFLDSDLIRGARVALTDRLAAGGLLDPAYPAIEAKVCAGKLPPVPADIAENNSELDRVIHGPELLGFYSALFGEPVRHYDFTWLRAVVPGKGSPPHCDLVYMGRGTHHVLTCWIPYGEVPLELGGLIVLENSHRQSARLKNYLELDVDRYCENHPREVEKVKEQGGWSHRHNGSLTYNPASLRERMGGRWLTTHWQPGDFITFKMNVVHASLDNQTDTVRLSSDTRYQRVSQPADPRWVGATPPGHGVRGKRGMIC
ncbi:MAG: phytanoyl-CoA dioxygenase, partial [Verrucomicrobia bacterium]|nr:phytanoyl-CoA dioxygenase [Verrucomicrobiota bacterium]